VGYLSFGSREVDPTDETRSRATTSKHKKQKAREVKKSKGRIWGGKTGLIREPRGVGTGRNGGLGREKRGQKEETVSAAFRSEGKNRSVSTRAEGLKKGGRRDGLKVERGSPTEYGRKNGQQSGADREVGKNTLSRHIKNKNNRDRRIRRGGKRRKTPRAEDSRGRQEVRMGVESREIAGLKDQLDKTK